MRLSNKKALITGGASGIGLEIARRFAAEGATVMLADLEGDKAEAAAAEIGAGHLGVAVDVADEASVRAMFDAARSGLVGVDILVTSAGVRGSQLIQDIDLVDWNRMLAVNLTGTFLCCREAARTMPHHAGASIITIGSVAGIRAHRMSAAYGASKAAVLHLTRLIAMDLAPSGIRANAIAPGPIRTPILDSIPAEVQGKYTKLIPMARFGDVSEIGGAAVFLGSDDASYITGETISVDGGFVPAGGIDI